MKRKIFKNKAKCLNCKEELESKHKDDQHSCKCYDYWLDKINLALEEYGQDSPELKKMYDHATGVLVNGGLDFIGRAYFNPSRFVEMSVVLYDNTEGPVNKKGD